jgi:hypothetical protein
MTPEVDARLELIARMMPTMKELRRMGADSEDVVRLLQFFVDELGDDDDRAKTTCDSNSSRLSENHG